MTNQRFCNACGKQNREQARFCGYCGKPLQATPPKKNALPNESFKEERAPFQIAEHEFNESGQKNMVGKTIKSISSAIIIVALLGLLAYTNPTLDSYESFVHQQILQESQKQDDLNRALGFFLGSIASRVIANLTIRKDYVFLSTYDTNIENEHLRVLGILNNFIILETPRSLKARH